MKKLLALILLLFAATAYAQTLPNANWNPSAGGVAFATVTMPSGFWTGDTNPEHHIVCNGREYIASKTQFLSKSTAAIVAAPSDTAGWTNEDSTNLWPHSLVVPANFETARYYACLASGHVGIVVANITAANWKEYYIDANTTTHVLTVSSPASFVYPGFTGTRIKIAQDPATGYLYTSGWRNVLRSTDGGTTFCAFTVGSSTPTNACLSSRAGGSVNFYSNLGFTDVGIYGISFDGLGYMNVSGEESSIKVSTANFSVASVVAFGPSTGSCATSPQSFCKNGFTYVLGASENIIEKGCPQGVSSLCRIAVPSGTVTDIGSINLVPYGGAGNSANWWAYEKAVDGDVQKGAAVGEYFMSGGDRNTAHQCGIFGTIDGGVTLAPVGWPSNTVFTCTSDTSQAPYFIAIDTSNDNKFFTYGGALMYHPGVIPPTCTHPCTWGLSEAYTGYANVLAMLQAKAAIPTAEMSALKSTADACAAKTVAAYNQSSLVAGQINYDYLGQGWKDCALPLALAYQIYGTASYGQKAIQILDIANAPIKNQTSLTVDGSNNKKVTAGYTFQSTDTGYLQVVSGTGCTPGWYLISSVASGAAILTTSPAAVGTVCQWNNTLPVTNNSGYPSRNIMPMAATVYDLVYSIIGSYANPSCSGCETTRQADTFASLNAWAAAIQNTGFFGSTPQMYSNYYAGNLVGITFAAYATSPTNTNAAALQNYVTNTLWKAANFTSGGFQGGYLVEGNNAGYGFYDAQWLMQVMQLVKDVSLTDLGVVSYGTKFATQLIHNIRPDRFSTINEGDVPNDCALTMPQGLALELSFHLYGQTAGAWMQYLYQNFATAPNSCYSAPPFAPTPFEKALYTDTSRTATSYSSQPLYYESSGDEHLFGRSDWTDTAVHYSFMGGSADYSIDHAMLPAGNILLQRGSDYLLVNSGQWHGTTGNSGSPASFDHGAFRSNTLYFADSNARCPSGSNLVGCQAYYGTNAVLKMGAGSTYVYEKSNLASAYLNSSSLSNVSTFQRSFIFLGDKYFVVFDRVAGTCQTYTCKMFWHSNKADQWHQSSQRFTSTVGASKITLDVLLPASATIAINPDGAAQGDLGATNPVTYRLEVSNGTPAATLSSLTVIALDGSGITAPAASSVTINSGTFVGAYIADSTPRFVFVSSDGSAHCAVNETQSFSGTANVVLVDWDTTNCATAYWKLTASTLDIKSTTGAGYAAVTPTSAGVVAFNIVSGGGVVMDHFTLSCDGNTSAGVAVNCTATAIGSDGNTFTSYTGNPTRTSSDAQFASTAFSSWTSGVATATFTPKTIPSQTITLTDGAYVGTSNSVGVVAANGAACSVFTSAPSPIATGTLFNWSVSIADAFGNAQAGSYSLTSSDGSATAALQGGAQAALPLSVNQAGPRALDVTFGSNGTQTLTATSSSPSFNCSQSGIVVGIPAIVFFPAHK